MKNFFFFRVEIDENNGNGHASRCLKFANFLKRRKKDVYFICSKKSKESLKKFTNFKFKILEIENIKNQKLDALKTIKIIKKNNSNLKEIYIIKDSYYLNLAWDRCIRKHLIKLIIIDDNFKKKHDCEIYINYNANNISQIIYKKKNTKYLIGLKYLIINKNKISKKLNKTLLIYLGASTQSKLLFKIAKSLMDRFFFSYKIIFLLGNFTKNKILFLNTFSKIINFQIIDKNINLPKYLSKFKYFVCSGGMSLWEAISLEIYPAAIPTNSNHYVIIKKLNKNKKVFYIKNNSKSFLTDFKQYIRISKKNKKNSRFFDYSGLKRIYQIINEIK